MSRPADGPAIWVDVEDFVDYFRANPHPSGIQRLAFEIKRALQQSGAPVRFVRRGSTGSMLQEMPWDAVAATMARTWPAAMRNPPAPSRTSRQHVQQLINTLPEHLRGPLLRAGVLQLHAARRWRDLARAFRRRPESAAPPAPAPIRQSRLTPESSSAMLAAPDMRPGDRFLVLGAPWAVPGFPQFLERLKRLHGVTAHLLLYDLIPVRHPEWCTKQAVALFEAWLDASLPLFDGLLAISNHTARDVEAYAAERGLVLAGSVQTIPIGTGFGASIAASSSTPGGLPAPGSYVLFVSTIEIRKNHALLFRVWRRLADEVQAGTRRPESLPTLVFAGRVGWLVADLMQQLENTRWLHGRIRLIPDPSDAELSALYEGCLFTLFPSWFEGWGLPVTESLAFGKPCLAANATALPEAGGALCRYFDPGDIADAHHAVATLLDDPAAIEAWTAAVRRDFRPVRWTETASAVLDALAA